MAESCRIGALFESESKIFYTIISPLTLQYVVTQRQSAITYAIPLVQILWTYAPQRSRLFEPKKFERAAFAQNCPEFGFYANPACTNALLHLGYRLKEREVRSS